MANTNELLTKVLKLHGGTDKWNTYQTLKAHVQIGGVTWSIKGQEGVLSDVHFTGQLHEQQASWQPIFEEGFKSEFTPQRVALIDTDGNMADELINPLDSFKGHQIETPWNRLQLVYFSSYATWNYLTTPFNFLQPGIQLNEIEPWQADDETWRRLEVIYPDSIATHSRRQVYYFSEEGYLKRHDYWPRVLGGSSATQIIEGYKEFSGIKTGTKRRIYILNDADNSYQTEPVLVSIDVLDVQFQ
ncbi:hypothetical protein QNI16_27045 [Cytophagaceae bacterium YF14B1]|uniref:Uncharacterized protein n=1 Tax=Xanthocytophaga flava TaxID=3048013 RepID=A0AAE3QRV6_9BACT|nr:hypothetical protein [Xanthocytophaga flavus]MDJ1484185.1 hypothetical protein [Xanthocytophaga flavus]